MTKKLAVLAVVMGVAGASCSGGHGASSLLPGGAVAPRGAHASDLVSAPPGWAATATRGATIAGATDKGPLAASTPLTVRVGLNLRNTDQLASAIVGASRPEQVHANANASGIDYFSPLAISV